ncbi:MAG: hypothetical protein R3D59_15590 [Paracoccaceae bacterium]
MQIDNVNGKKLETWTPEEVAKGLANKEISPDRRAHARGIHVRKHR